MNEITLRLPNSKVQSGFIRQYQCMLTAYNLFKNKISWYCLIIFLKFTLHTDFFGIKIDVTFT